MPVGSPVVLGVDPDTQATGLALLQGEKVLMVGLAAIDRHLEPRPRGKDAAGLMAAIVGWKIRNVFKGHEYAVVEFPQVYKGKKVDPNNLTLLAAVSGAVCAAVGHFHVHLTYPTEWKGQTPKSIHQKRILKRIGWEFVDNGVKKCPTPIVPEDVKVIGDVPEGRWKEIVDAIGIALHAAS